VPNPASDTIGGDIVVDVPPGGTMFTVVAGDAIHAYTAWGAQELPPGPPQTLIHTVDNRTVTLNWQPPTTGGIATSYVVEAALFAGGPAIATLPVNTTTLTVPNVPNGTFFVRVRALNADGQSAPSNEVMVAVPGGPGVCAAAPAAPATLTHTVNGSLVTLNWSAPATGCTPTRYVLQAGTAPGMSDVVVANTGLHTSLSASAPPGTYFVRVVAVNPFGTSVPSNEEQVTIAGCGVPPDPPQNLVGFLTGSTVHLGWNPPASGCEPTSYVVQAGRAPGQSDVVAANVGLQTSLSAGAPSGTYFIRVVALNPVGSSVPSNEISLTVICLPPAAPSLGSPFVSGSTVSLSWSPVSGATRYIVQAGSSSGATNLLNTSTTNTSYSWERAPTGAHFIRVRAVNNCGNGPASNQVTAIVSGGGGGGGGGSCGPTSAPCGQATARCRDGTYSCSRNRSGTCSHHGGVACWICPGPLCDARSDPFFAVAVWEVSGGQCGAPLDESAVDDELPAELLLGGE
jgi:hypothetical protein